jgi:hypothetical protein
MMTTTKIARKMYRIKYFGSSSSSSMDFKGLSQYGSARSCLVGSCRFLTRSISVRKRSVSDSE